MGKDNKKIKRVPGEKPNDTNLSVAGALADLKKLKKATGSYYPETVTLSQLDEKIENSSMNDLSSNEQLNDNTETGYKIRTRQEDSGKAFDSVESSIKKIDAKTQNEIAGLKSKCQNISITISFAICGIVSAILIAVLIYFHGNLNSEIKSIQTLLSNTFQAIETKISSLDSKITAIENKRDVKKNN